MLATQFALARRHALDLFVYHPRVKEALSTGLPVIALESTIITHGMPYPQNLETARIVESIISSNGCVPATIALLSGKVHIGLTENQLEYIAKTTKAIKTSLRDLAYVQAQRLDGGTTVASTMRLAKHAGIPIFCTGGIGGVHRGAEITMDISADLTELGRTNVAVVCAGAKSILDIGRTLEYLETQGVPVTTLGPTDDFPAFYARTSGFRSPLHTKTPAETAELIKAQSDLDIKSGIVIATPIPEEYAVSGQFMEEAINIAIDEAVRTGIAGKKTTPFILKRVGELTKGQSLISNIALVKNNALVSSQIAVEYSKLTSEKSSFQPVISETTEKLANQIKSLPLDTDDISVTSIESQCVIIGGAVVDVSTRLKQVSGISEFTQSTFIADKAKMMAGGVARNIAEAVHRLGTSTTFVSIIGVDFHGDYLMNEHKKLGIQTLWQRTEQAGTATGMLLLNPQGDLISGGIYSDVHQHLKVRHLSMNKDKVKIVVIDGNLSKEAIIDITQIAFANNIPILFEPTSMSKASKIVSSKILNVEKQKIVFMTPNMRELRAMFHAATECNLFNSAWQDKLESFGIGLEYRHKVDEFMARYPHLSYLKQQGVLQQSIHLLPYIPNHIITLGKDGVLLVELVESHAKEEKDHIGWTLNGISSSIRWTYSAGMQLNPTEIKSTTGAGDSFAGAIASAIVRGFPLYKNLDRCQLAALASLKYERCISMDLDGRIFDLAEL